jgi:hypothetical protein
MARLDPRILSSIRRLIPSAFARGATSDQALGNLGSVASLQTQRQLMAPRPLFEGDKATCDLTEYQHDITIALRDARIPRDIGVTQTQDGFVVDGLKIQLKRVGKRFEFKATEHDLSKEALAKAVDKLMTLAAAARILRLRDRAPQIFGTPSFEYDKHTGTLSIGFDADWNEQEDEHSESTDLQNALGIKTGAKQQALFI